MLLAAPPPPSEMTQSHAPLGSHGHQEQALNNAAISLPSQELCDWASVPS